MELRSPIIIIEGPAGSGKSTLAKHIEQDLGATLVQRSLPQRNPSALEAALISWRNDILKLQDALVVRKQLAVIDRLVFSQWVYGYLRAKKDQPAGNALRVWNEFERLAIELINDVNHRLEPCGCGTVEIPRIMLIVLLPPQEVLEKFRAKSKRDYPWTAKAELHAYEKLAEYGRLGMMVEKVIPWRNQIHGPLRTQIEHWLGDEEDMGS